jgi:hypothetical protein
MINLLVDINFKGIVNLDILHGPEPGDLSLCQLPRGKQDFIEQLLLRYLPP